MHETMGRRLYYSVRDIGRHAVQAKQVVCVFDLVGKNGDVYNLMQDYQLAAKNWVPILNYVLVKTKGLSQKTLKQVSVMRLV